MLSCITASETAAGIGALLIDYTAIETRKTRAGWELLCPACQRWHRWLWCIGDGRAVCRGCIKAERIAVETAG